MDPDVLTWIEQQKPALVKIAEDYVRDTSPGLFDVSPSQLRNLLVAAQAGHSVPLLVNLLRYQLGRTSNAWSEPTSGKKLLTLLEGVARRVAERCAGSDDEAMAYTTQARMAALLLGYIIREFTYRKKFRGR